jgi:L-ribulokinase
MVLADIPYIRNNKVLPEIKAVKNNQYALGLDFGTESVRCLAVDIDSGEEKAVAVYEYPDGVITQKLPKTSISLGAAWALQNPQNWVDGMRQVVHQVLQDGRIDSSSVVSLGLCFTSSTILPTTEDGVPLCFLTQWMSEPHAWPKLWKHHAAQTEATLINEIACKEHEPWLERYGGMISSEWLFPKALQVYKESPECFAATKRFIEGGDWIVWKLVGKEMRSVCQAGYKALWNPKEGYPSAQFLEKLGKGFGVVLTKLGKKHFPIGTRAGGLTIEMASQLRLPRGTPVATAIIDAHAAVFASGVAMQGRMVLVTGTSTCHLVMDDKEIFSEGIAGVVRDGILPGYFAYESGQSAVGDILAWITKQGIPEDYNNESKELGISIHDLLVRKSVIQKPGQHGLLALDWLNGNRSVLMNSNLSGVLVGLTLNTKPEDIYRAMIEATAFGTRLIIETYENSGIRIKELYACGGLIKNSMLLQIYSDITGRTIKVAASSQTMALGAAILGVLTADSKSGRSSSYADVVSRMTKPAQVIYHPNPENQKIYEKLFKEYLVLHDYFGREKPSLMKGLKFPHD